MKGLVSVCPTFGRAIGGNHEGYVVLTVPGVGVALTVENSQALRAELENAERALIEARALSEDQRALLATPVEGAA